MAASIPFSHHPAKLVSAFVDARLFESARAHTFLRLAAWPELFDMLRFSPMEFDTGKMDFPDPKKAKVGGDFVWMDRV